MYTLKLDNCNSPRIKMEIDFPSHMFDDIHYAVCGDFREICIVNLETGEVIYSEYNALEHFQPSDDSTNIINIVLNLLKNASIE